MEWKPEFATGIHNIDDQHRIIVDFITRYERMGEAGSDDLPWLIRHTREFVEHHFRVEESLMQLLPYPYAAAHRAEHRAVLRQIAQVEAQLGLDRRSDNLAALMRDYLFEHIVAGDKWLGQYALDLYGRRPARAAPPLRPKDPGPRLLRW